LKRLWAIALALAVLMLP